MRLAAPSLHYITAGYQSPKFNASFQHYIIGYLTLLATCEHVIFFCHIQRAMCIKWTALSSNNWKTEVITEEMGQTDEILYVSLHTNKDYKKITQ